MHKRKPRKDPQRAREARRYEHPIASREYLLQTLETHDRPLSAGELSAALGVESARDIVALTRRLRAMERDGQIIRNRRGDYGLVRKMDLIPGRVIAHRDGFGFVVPDDGGQDLFLSPREMRGLMHGDRAVARVTEVDRQGRRQGALVEVLERNTHRVVGRYRRDSGVGFVTPDNRRLHHDIMIPDSATGRAGHGQVVVAEIVEQPTKRSQPIGQIVEVMGDHMAPGMEIDVAIRAHELPFEWPDAVIDEAEALPSQVSASAASGRTDLRQMPLVTIDGADARDFDDAVFCIRSPSGWKLTVAIADVAAYVKPGSPLDTEARLRGTSVYFPQRVLPMLPEKLSNGLCSLRPDEDRLCMVCEMHVGRDGQIKRSRFFEAVMRSRARLTYDEVAAAVVERDSDTRRRLSGVIEQLDELYAMYAVLKSAREGRGAMDFDTQEARIVFGADKKIEAIETETRNDAHRVIEECMIAANVATARFLERHRIPVLYRVHDRPTPDRLADLREFLAEVGMKLAGGAQPEAHHFAELLERSAGRADAELIQTVLLRSLAQAAYSPRNIGHFGLALESYAHFTSPIRRYPDLLVHRAIKHLTNKQSLQSFEYDSDAMVSLGADTSMTERRADDATRDAVSWLKCEFMLDRIGEQFDGTIVGVTSFGLFVNLDGIHVEGLIHVSALGSDYFHYDPAGHRLAGEHTGVVFRLADRVRVVVQRVDLDERKIDLELVDVSQRRGVRRGPKRGRGKRSKKR
ncbi:MAG: ribonuclease R [Gammaproteobacteria bacterium]|jgi:ribonuclease R|nr:ribonuclease R [Gammaproteobacteria bacterium]